MKRVLITGGSGGIGAGIVRAFCKNGDTVVFTYHHNLKAAQVLAEETGATALCADLGDSESVRFIVESAKDIMGGIDVLVHAAGIAQIKLFDLITDEDWSALLSANLSSAFYVCREISRIMLGAHTGRIVLIGSMWGKVGASCEVAYSATKAGVRGMTMALSKELGPSGITVNCIEPGVIDTPMNACFDTDTRKALAEDTPMGRIGTPEDVAALAVFLASDAASFITGQCIGVDGGFAI
ncbi:MAG: 3-oxoacyl-ACP reductase FabG [Clostridia bacterium]|nr:3-oxoacyl-ACP reductase FabG [Clostridia bacterium]